MIVLLLFLILLGEVNNMKETVQVELSNEEDKIVQIYRLEHNKKNNAEAIKEIIRHYRPLKEYKEKNKRKWFKI